MMELQKEIEVPKEIYISPEERQQMIEKLKMI